MAKMTHSKSFEEEFGENVYTDLKFIRDWRNKVSHPEHIISPPDGAEALQVIKRADMFCDLFKEMFKPFSFE